MRRAWRVVGLLAWLAGSLPVWADGGSVLVRSPGEPWQITALGSPDPLRVGEVDLSVLVTDTETGRPVLDAEVELRLRPPAEPTRDLSNSTHPTHQIQEAHEARHAHHAQLGAGTNGLLYSAWPRLTSPGVWELEVTVERRGITQRATTSLEVAPPRSALLLHWPALALPPLGIALFAVHQTLVRRRPGWALRLGAASAHERN
ncbi:hypothetical protein MK489_05310 [Myxococcota bacterium]|nr:hypothetical protein [Myxococcota bacterium]